MRVGAGRYGARVPWVDVLLSAIAAVSWALIGMIATAALGLRLLDADAAGSAGPMAAAVVALGAGGSVSPSGEVSVFGLTGAEAATAVEITPLGVSLVGALLLSWIFLRSLRAAGVEVSAAELLARVGAVVVLFTAGLGGLAWAGHDVITIDGDTLGPDDAPGSGELPGGDRLDLPGPDGLGDIGGLLPDGVGDLIGARVAVDLTVDIVPTLLGGLGWSAGVLLIALLAARRTPLPRGLAFVHRVVRPTVSALVTVALVAVAAGCAAAGHAAIGDDHPRRVVGAALLGAPNGVWLGLPVGLFVPYEGDATGPLTGFLPDPLDDLLADSDGPVTLGRLADLDGRVWLLGVAAVTLMLLAGVVAAVRTPVGGGGSQEARGLRGPGVGGFVGRCAVRLGCVTALALPLLGRLTDVSVNTSLSVLGFEAFGAGIELHGRTGAAVLLGAVWGAGAGAAGALLACATGAAGRGVAGLALGDSGAAGASGQGAGVSAPPRPRTPPQPRTPPRADLAGSPVGSDRAGSPVGAGPATPPARPRRPPASPGEGPPAPPGPPHPPHPPRPSSPPRPPGPPGRPSPPRPSSPPKGSG
ncbi:streptophobe family protein [Streptomyces sp. NPDC091377]|uniref:streptophobe family protein n=1 Tax=Streptomyces sp. NPDC091377 TaxID=3365995 RepID=UPI003804FF3D